MAYLTEGLTYAFPVDKYGITGIEQDSTYEELFEGFLSDFGIRVVGETFEFDQNAPESSYFKRLNNWTTAFNEVALTDPDTFGLGAFYNEGGELDTDFVSANYNGYKAFTFYFNSAARSINNANNTISQALSTVAAMTTLTKADQIWTAMNSLGLLKKKLDDALGSLGGYMDSTTQSKTIATNYEPLIDLSGIDNLPDLRQLIQTDDTKFANITILDKIKFIGAYYAIGKNDCSSLVFPQSSSGVPCIPNPDYNSATQQRTILGGFEDFYTALLIDRDGPINALSNILEIKVDALRAELSLYSEYIQALNQYTIFINKGIEVLNNSQKGGYISSDDKNIDGKAKEPFATAAFNIFSAFCCGSPARSFYKYEGENYLIVQYDNTTAEFDDVEYNKSKTFTGCYMLIRATEDGISDFCNMYKGADEKKNYEALIEKFQTVYGGTPGTNTYPTKSFSNGYLVTDDVETTNSDAKDNIKFLLFEDAEAEVNNLPIQFNVALLERSVYAYGVSTVAEGYDPANGIWYGNGRPWDNTRTIDSVSGALKSWTDAFSRYSGYIDSKIQETNTDITGSRQKTDTLDTTSSSFRKRAHDVYTGIVSKI